MKNNTALQTLRSITFQLLRWTLRIIPVAIITGSLVALFLWLLDQATALRWQHPWLLYLLPLAGVFIYWLYKIAGRNAAAGNNLIMEEIHHPAGGVPARMAPLVLLTTVVTHLFGGSAGREGTAVQIGGSMAAKLGKWMHLKPADTSILLMTGIAAGFGAVFGTPLAGTIFALEVLAIGAIRYNALLPCLMAAIGADIVCSAWGITHTHYQVSFHQQAASITIPYLKTDLLLLGKVIVAGVAFGLAGNLFARSMHLVKDTAQRFIRIPWLIPVIGGGIIITLCWLLGTRDYIGLGVSSQHPNGVSILSAFNKGGADTWSWLLKLIFTAITLGMGFKGGEVTPLFFIGATLGSTLAVISGAPIDLFAALGFIAVFAGATNTPIACMLMGVELFGTEHILYYAVACFTAYYFSGHAGIYQAQRIAVNKDDSQSTSA